MIDDSIRNQVWKKGIAVDGYDPNLVRVDACGAFMVRSYTNRENDYAWEVDHIIPVATLNLYGVEECDADNIVNLRPLNWHNNVSKGDDCPRYKSAFTREGEYNVEKDKHCTVNKRKLQAALDYFKHKGYDIQL